jgi:hypothetical protein
MNDFGSHHSGRFSEECRNPDINVLFFTRCDSDQIQQLISRLSRAWNTDIRSPDLIVWRIPIRIASFVYRVPDSKWASLSATSKRSWTLAWLTDTTPDSRMIVLRKGGEVEHPWIARTFTNGAGGDFLFSFRFLFCRLYGPWIVFLWKTKTINRGTERSTSMWVEAAMFLENPALSYLPSLAFSPDHPENVLFRSYRYDSVHWAELAKP